MKAFQSPSAPYKVTMNGYTFPVKFWIGDRRIRTFAREGQSFKRERTRAALSNHKHVPCTELYVDRMGRFTLDSYYFIEGKFKPPCVKPPRKEMFAVFDLFALQLGFDKIYVNDISFLKLPYCEWDLAVLEKIRSGQTFYEKQGYVYEASYPDVNGTHFLKGTVRDYAGSDALKQVVERLHTDCSTTRRVKKIKSETIRFQLNNQIRRHFHISDQFVKHLSPSSSTLTIVPVKPKH
jgi:hypothetical protein